jgi:hypothetical protein
MKFKYFPRVQLDETLSSWLYRSLQNTNLRNCVDLENLAGYDEDYDFSVLIHWRTALALDVEPTDVVRCFKPATGWLLPWDERQTFCPRCLDEDVSGGRLPYWRKYWCYSYCPICFTHGQLLMRMDVLRGDFNRAWESFCHYDDWSMKTQNSRCKSTTLSYPDVSAKTISMAIKAQKLIHLAHRAQTIRINDTVLPSVDVLNLCAFIFDHLLFPKTPGSNGGAARYRATGIPKARIITKQSKFYMSFEDCDVFSRLVALLIVGLVLKLVTAAEIQSVSYELQLPVSMCDGELSSLAYCFTKVGSSSRVIAANQLVHASKEFVEYLSDFYRVLSRFSSVFLPERILRDSD